MKGWNRLTAAEKLTASLSPRALYRCLHCGVRTVERDRLTHLRMWHGGGVPSRDFQVDL